MLKRIYLLLLILLPCAAIAQDSDSLRSKADTMSVDTIQPRWIKYHLTRERTISDVLRGCSKKYDIGQAVDLNDYLCWLDSTKDWEEAVIHQEVEEWLNDKGVFYDDEYKEWILQKKRHYRLLEKPVYYSVSRVGASDLVSCHCEWKLEGRHMVSRMVLPDVSLRKEPDGVVVVRIFVTARGRIWLTTRAKGTTAKNPLLIAATKDAAKQARFDEGKPQIGTITYTF